MIARAPFARLFARLGLAVSALLFLVWQVQAECRGINLVDALPPDQAAALDRAVAAQPYAQGNFWRAEKDGRSLWLIGTYHYDDSRHTPAVEAAARLLPRASQLLVEAGPEQKRQLMRALAERPELLSYTEGPGLPERLPPEDWAALRAALASRNLPAAVIGRMRPWYVSVLLATPACQIDEAAAENGLDAQIIARAKATGTPIRALEPFDTVFTLFDAMSEAEQMAMIHTTLQIEPQAADHARTLGDLYFRGEGRRMWEFSRLFTARLPGYDMARADAEFARMEELLMTRRNRAWLPVLEEAARGGDVLATFGALHLAGETGVLNLLAGAGWRIERLDWADAPR